MTGPVMAPLTDEGADLRSRAGAGQSGVTGLGRDRLLVDGAEVFDQTLAMREGGWTLEAGTFTLLAGSSSASLPLTASVKL